MANATWEEASRCPKCTLKGKEGASRVLSPGPRVTPGAKIITMTCMNSRCKWFETNWEVQVNPDGTIPLEEGPRRKQFPKVDEALVAQVQAAGQAWLEKSLEQGEGR